MEITTNEKTQTEEICEIWKPLPYEGYTHYEASNLGSVRRIKKVGVGINIKPIWDGRYFHVRLYSNKILLIKNLHRVVYEAFNGITEGIIDHKDKNRANFKLDNLRVVSASLSSHNKHIQRNNRTGFKGICKVKGDRWIAQTSLLKKILFLGYYDSPQEAALAYDIKAKELWGEEADLNFPREFSEGKVPKRLGRLWDTGNPTATEGTEICIQKKSSDAFREQYYEGLAIRKEHDKERLQRIESNKRTTPVHVPLVPYKGVTKVKQKRGDVWRAYLRTGSTTTEVTGYFIGNYNTPEEAAHAYDLKCIELGKERVNFKDGPPDWVIAEFNRRDSSPLPTKSRTGFKGIQQIGKRFQTRVFSGRKLTYQKYWDTAEEAARDYDRKLIEAGERPANFLTCHLSML